jgi:hypothetical protein
MPRGADDPAAHALVPARTAACRGSPHRRRAGTPRGTPCRGVPHQADPARSHGPHINGMEGPVATRGTRRAVGPREPTKKGYR